MNKIARAFEKWNPTQNFSITNLLVRFLENKVELKTVDISEASYKDRCKSFIARADFGEKEGRLNALVSRESIKPFYENMAKELGILDKLKDFNDHRSLGIPKEYIDQHYESITYAQNSGIYPKNGYGLVECIKENRFVTYLFAYKQCRIDTLEDCHDESLGKTEEEFQKYCNSGLKKLRKSK